MWSLSAFLGLYALVWLAAQKERPSLSWLIGAAALFFLGLTLVWLLGLAFVRSTACWMSGTRPWAPIWALGAAIRPGSFTIFMISSFSWASRFLFSGWRRRCARCASGRRVQRDVLAISFAIALILFNLSGLSQGEVARVWAFLLPLALLIGVRRVPKHGLIFTGLAALLVLQVLVSNTFLQPVSTGLLDPPAPPQTAVVPAQSAPAAIWEDGLVLENISFSQAEWHRVADELVETGQPITIEAVWNSSKQSEKPYTLFIHLLDEQGRLAAQYDGLPLGGEWLTTCWQVGQPFRDEYELPLPDDLAPGLYKMYMGFYFWPTGERLPLVEPDGRVDHHIVVGAIRLDE